MKLLLTFSLVLLTFAGISQQKDTLTIMSLNVLNYPNGCGTAIPDREDTLRKVVQYVQADIFMICELQEEFGADSILNRSLNVFGANNYARANWVPNGSSSNNLQNMLFYNTDKLTLQSQDEITTSLRDINHYVLYVNDPFLGVHEDTIFFEMYMCHLKAGTGSTNENERDAMAQLIRAHIDSRPADRHFFVGGDFNVYDDQEPAYITLTSGGSNPLFDPINQAGSWHDDASYAGIHSQSPRTVSLDCGATAGLDDRFDQILVTQNIMNGSDSASYVSGTYKAIGNDGQHFNMSLLDPPTNSMYPDSIVKAVYYISDHLPIVMDVAIAKAWDDIQPQVDQQGDCICYNTSSGNIELSATGGTPPYIFDWGSSPGTFNNGSATNLSTGTYCCTISDQNGYEDSICVTINQPIQLSYSLTTTPDYGNCDGTATVTPSGGTAGYTFDWPVNTTALCAGDTICVIMDSNGCLDTAYISIADSSNASIHNFNELQLIKVYPNPFSESVIIDASNFTETFLKVKLFDITGQLLISEEIWITAPHKLIIPASNIPKGTYLLEISNGYNQLLLRLMK